jgi:hypothetical protein
MFTAVADPHERRLIRQVAFKERDHAFCHHLVPQRVMARALAYRLFRRTRTEAGCALHPGIAAMGDCEWRYAGCNPVRTMESADHDGVELFPPVRRCPGATLAVADRKEVARINPSKRPRAFGSELRLSRPDRKYMSATQTADRPPVAQSIAVGRDHCEARSQQSSDGARLVLEVQAGAAVQVDDARELETWLNSC